MRFSQFPEGDGGGGGNVEGIDMVVHGDADNIVGGGNGGMGESVTLGAHDDGETRFLAQYR